MSIRLYIYPSTKSFFDFNEIWYVGRGRRVMHYFCRYMCSLVGHRRWIFVRTHW